jgi:hypothetical protein
MNRVDRLIHVGASASLVRQRQEPRRRSLPQLRLSKATLWLETQSTVELRST